MRRVLLAAGVVMAMAAPAVANPLEGDWILLHFQDQPGNLFPSEFNDFEASWSPDGNRIVFESVRNEDFAVSIFDLTAGTSVDVLTRPTAATFRSPVWVRITADASPVATTIVGSATTTVPSGEEKESSIDPMWIALFGTLVAVAAIGIALARQSAKGKEPPPPPAAPEN